MKIKTKELKKALDAVKPALATSDKIEQAKSFAFIEGFICTYNNEISISYPLSDLKKLTGAIKADELYKYVGKLKSEEIQLEIDKKQILIKSGKAKSGFILEKEVTLPIESVLNSKKGDWKEISKEFLSALHFASITASNDTALPKFQCVHITKGFVEATDNNRVFRQTVKTKVPTTLIVGANLKTILRIKPTHIASGDSWLHFKNDKTNIVASCRTVNEDYVNMDAALDIKGKGIKMTFPENILEILDKAQVFSQRQDINDEEILFKVKENELTIHSESATGWFEESLNFKSKKDFKFRFIPYVLKDIIQEVPNCKFYNQRLLFEKDNWVYVIRLL